MKILKKYIALLLCISLLCVLTGCAGLFGSVEELKGSITGNTYACKFYSNKGKQFMTVNGQQIDLETPHTRNFSRVRLHKALLH